ncbi:hypothetical protein [Streptomyces daliensis]|uniref:Uncharacterized protein n=1 Tax=Streptomyces daliensis TaxID=299421 RepID=A0A8T4J009_9ACTN|nr:hypothetical protein [Streptomyces daliensis]
MPEDEARKEAEVAEAGEAANEAEEMEATGGDPAPRVRPERPERPERDAETTAEIQFRVGRHIAELAERLDPDSFALFLKVMAGLNRAFAQHNQYVDIELTPEEQELCTPQFQRELVTLLEKTGIPSDRVTGFTLRTSRTCDRDRDRDRNSRRDPRPTARGHPHDP